MNLVKLMIVILAAAAFVVSCGQPAATPNGKNTAANTTAATTPAKPPATADETAAGTELYARHCMICHKDSGKGGKVTIEGRNLDPDDLTSEKMKKQTDEKLFAHISDGVADEGMPAFKGKLTEDQIKSIVKHLRALQSSTGALGLN